MIYVKGAIAIVAIYCLFLFHQGAKQSGIDEANVACQGEDIQELEDKNAKIAELTSKNLSLKASADKASVKVATKLGRELQEVKNERDAAYNRASAATDKLLRLVQGEDKDGLGGIGQFAVTPTGECNGEEVSRRTKEGARLIIEAQRRHGQRITDIASDSDSTASQLEAAQQQLINDRKKKDAIDAFLNGE